MDGPMESSSRVDRAADIVNDVGYLCSQGLLYMVYGICWASYTAFLLCKRSIDSVRNAEACSWKRWKLPITIFAMVAFSFSVGVHIGYDKAFDENLSTSGSTEYSESTKFAKKRKPRPILDLIGIATKERKRVHATLREEYGVYYGSIFNGSLLRRIFVAEEESRRRLARRIMIKVLSAQFEPEAYTRFTWATAGDSAAAGHGNRAGQSYTTAMEMTVREAFASVGVNFISRNHGMGGAVSAPELAVCQEAVYGNDVDVLNWDFGVSEARDNHRTMLWAARTAVQSEKPILFMQDSISSGRFDQIAPLEDSGLATLLMNTDAMGLLLGSLPDLTDESINQADVPPNLRYFVCGSSFEGYGFCEDAPPHFICGKPGGIECRDAKYNVEEGCVDERFNTVWNPGWRLHLLKGRLLGAFLLDMLVDALIELDELEHPQSKEEKIGYGAGDYKSILAFLRHKDSVDQFLYETAQISVADTWEGIAGLPEEILSKGRAICRTALLPSQQRLDLEHGSATEFSLIPFTNNTLVLAYDPRDRHRCNGQNMDARDFFYAPPGSASVSTRFPNGLELGAYIGDRSAKKKMTEAVIMLCFSTCLGDTCEAGWVDTGSARIEQGNIKVQVDGRKVTGSIEVDGCHFLQGDEGISWGLLLRGEPSFDVQIWLDENNESLRITSMAVIFPP